MVSLYKSNQAGVNFLGSDVKALGSSLVNGYFQVINLGSNLNFVLLEFHIWAFNGWKFMWPESQNVSRQS